MKSWFKNIEILGLTLTLISAVTLPKLAPIFWVLYFLGSKFSGRQFEKYLSRGIQLNILILILLRSISYFYSVDKSLALDQFIHTLPLFIIPIVLTFQNKSIDLKVFVWLILGALIISGIAQQFIYINNSTSLISPKHSSLINGDIYSMFLCAGISFLLYMKLTRYSFVLQGMLILLLSLLILQTHSYLGVAVLILISIIWMIKYALLKLKWLPTLIILFVSLFVSFKLLNIKSSIETCKTLWNSDIVLSTSPSSNNVIEAKVLCWKAAFSLIEEAPLKGYGIGNVKHQLTKKQYQLGYNGIAKKELNAQNQFLSFGLEMGVVGILVYFILILSIFYSSYKHRSGVYFSIGLIVFINSFFISFLEFPEGICFFSILVLLLYKIGLFDRLKTQQS